jgi:hypothetical protein
VCDLDKSVMQALTPSPCLAGYNITSQKCTGYLAWSTEGAQKHPCTTPSMQPHQLNDLEQNTNPAQTHAQSG